MAGQSQKYRKTKHASPASVETRSRPRRMARYRDIGCLNDQWSFRYSLEVHPYRRSTRPRAETQSPRDLAAIVDEVKRNVGNRIDFAF